MGSLRNFSLFLAICMVGAGCGVSRNAAMKLADAGGSACGVARVAMMSVDQGLKNYAESEVFWRAFVGSKLDTDTDEAFKEMQKLHDVISIRIAMISELNTMYDGLRRLAEHEFAANVESSVGSLATSVTSYARIVGAPELVNVIKGIAGAVADAVQRGQLDTANKEFAKLLPKIVDLLKKEVPGYESLIRQSKEAQWKLVEALLNDGIGEPDALLAAVLEEVGVSFDAKRFRELDATKQASARNGMKALIELRIDEQIKAQKTILEDSIATLETLRANHDRLVGKNPIDLESIAAVTSRLRVIAEAANAYAKAVAEARAARAAAQGGQGGLRRQLLGGLRTAIEEEIKRRFPVIP